MNTLKTLTLLACFALGACGGGGGGSTTPAPVAKTVSISQYGDSTTVGLVAGATVQPPGGGPTFMLQTMLQAKYGPSVTVINKGVGGGTVQDLIDGTGVFTVKLVDQLKTDQSQIVTIRFGLNDYNKVDAATFKASLVTAVQLMQAAGKTVIVEEITPTTNYIYAKEQDYADAADQVSQQFSTPLVKSYSLTLAIPNWINMMSDLQHPTEALYQLLAAEQLPTIEPLLDILLK